MPHSPSIDRSPKKLALSDYSIVDLFCGIGGLTHGFYREGFTNISGVDSDETCKYAYEANNFATFHHEDIANLTAEKLETFFEQGKRRILIGCAPCQPYSILHRKVNKASVNIEERWKLLYSFANLIIETKPEIISMENVPLLKSFKSGVVLNDFISTLKQGSYHVGYDIIGAQNYGVPQRRQRLVLLGSLHSNIPIPPPTFEKGAFKSVRSAIGDLPELEDGETSKSDILHRARKLSALSKERIKATPEGGSWKDWDEALKLECHKREGGKKYGSVYGRMEWEKPSPTITTYCAGINTGRFGHPVQDRPISLREAALLQSFPKTYNFVEGKKLTSASNTAKHIGNAVPPLLGQAIARSIKNHIKSISL